MVAPASVDSVLSSPGSPLESGLQQDMRQRFGHDFSRVRVHTDAAAARSARDVNANAYTVRHNIAFGAGQFAPGTYEGRRLIAHELTHVVQQSGSDGIHDGQDGEKCGLSTITPKAPHHRERAAGTNPVIATSQFMLRSAPNAPMLQMQLAPDAEPAKTGSQGAAIVEGIASKPEGTKTEDRSTAADAGKGAPFLGLSPEKVQAAAEEVVARVEGAAERGKAEAVQATKLIQWGTLKIPIDESLLKSKNVNYELAIRYFQAVLKRVGVELEYWMAERIHARLAWKDLSTEDHTRQVVSDLLAAKDNTIGYTSNKDSSTAVVTAYYDILREDQERLRRIYEELHKVHYAEDAILSFYIAHVNGVISVVNGILDLPIAPFNLVQSVQGKEPYRLLGRIPKIDYVGEYGKKYGGAMETGVVLGLMLVPGAQGSAGPVLSSAKGGAALAEGAGVAMPLLTRLLGGAKVATPVIKIVKWLLGVAGVAVGGQAVVDTAKAIKALKTGQITNEDGTVEPLTEEKAFELLEAILVNMLIAKHTAKGVLESKTGKGKEEAPPKTETPETKTTAPKKAEIPAAETPKAKTTAPKKTETPEAETPEAPKAAPPPTAKTPATPEAETPAPKPEPPKASIQEKIVKLQQEVQTLRQKRTEISKKLSELEKTVEENRKLQRDPSDKEQALAAKKRADTAAEERNALVDEIKTLNEDIEKAEKNLKGTQDIKAERLESDINVDPKPPDKNNGNGTIGRTPNQELQVDADIAEARKQGATDIRKNQHQVDAMGNRVGTNKPDLQYTLNGERIYIEYEQLNNPRGAGHTKRILANDPSGKVQVKLVPKTPGFRPNQGVTVQKFP